MRVFIIGSNSFSGTHFAKFCLDKGFDVTGASRSSFPKNLFLAHPADVKDFRFLQMDLNKEINRYFELILEEKFDYIVNFSSQSMVAQSWDSPEDWFQTNVMSTTKLYDFIAKNFKTIGLKKLVHVSTPEVYGNCNGFVKETQAFAPSTPYATSRAAGDFHLRNLGERYDLPYIITRASNVYGEHQQLYRIIPRAMLFALVNKRLMLHGGGLSKRNFIHIYDVCRATFDLMNSPCLKDEFHISGKELISIRDLVKQVADITNVSFEKLVEVVPERAGKDFVYSLSVEKLKTQLSWQTEIDLDSGLRRTFNWVRENLEDLKVQEQDYKHKI